MSQCTVKPGSSGGVKAQWYPGCSLCTAAGSHGIPAAQLVVERAAVVAPEVEADSVAVAALVVLVAVSAVPAAVLAVWAATEG